MTDANLVLGRLDAARFLGGRMALHEASAPAAVGALAAEMGATVEGAALAIARVANAAMERAIRRVSVERGHDPRRFTLVAFGGGGPLHACELAEALGIPRVLIPPTPGVLSALGMLAAAPTRDTSRTALRPLADGGQALAAWLAEAFAPLAARAIDEMAAEGHDAAALTLRQALDLRYVGQSHELTVDTQPGDGAAEIVAAFHAAHSRALRLRSVSGDGRTGDAAAVGHGRAPPAAVAAGGARPGRRRRGAAGHGRNLVCRRRPRYDAL